MIATETARALKPAEQIAGYLKLTHAHYRVIDRHFPSPLLELRSNLAAEMDVETYLMALEIRELLSDGGRW